LCMRMGEMLSITSAGTPRMPLGMAVAERPSLGPGTHPTAGEEDVGEGLTVRLLARDLGIPQAVGPLGEDPLRDDLRQRTVDKPRQKVPPNLAFHAL
jgi:hypothetical protein